MRCVVDTDVGLDDACALDLLLDHAHVMAVTLVFGNVALDVAAEGARTVIASRPRRHVPPVYRGCVGPLLLGAPLPGWPGHGADGLGGASAQLRGLARAPVPVPDGVGHAAQALVELAGGDVTLIALGPLTNVAVALQLDPLLPTRYARVIIMGGTSRGMGNASAAAEFNFFSDPEAAHVVLRAFGSRVTLVPWEATVDAPLPWATFDALPATSLLRLVCASYATDERAKGGALVICDLLAAIVALDDAAVSKSSCLRAHVETGGGCGRGAVHLDWYGTDKTHALRLVEAVSVERLVGWVQRVWMGASP